MQLKDRDSLGGQDLVLTEEKGFSHLISLRAQSSSWATRCKQAELQVDGAEIEHVQ